jgi:hypothetical protein
MIEGLPFTTALVKTGSASPGAITAKAFNAALPWASLPVLTRFVSVGTALNALVPNPTSP